MAKSKYLATFSGKFGDILWALPTVKCLSEVLCGGTKFDFCTMPIYKSLVPLIQSQSYIEEAGYYEGWILWHDCYGAQPWQPPKEVEAGYERCWHLGYRHHPGLNGTPSPLIEFTAAQQGLKLKDPIPFLTVPHEPTFEAYPYVAYSFNEQYADMKGVFLACVKALLPQVPFVNVQDLDWIRAGSCIKQAMCFLGCRSSNNVMAHGVGQKNIFIYEPHPARHQNGSLGAVFGNPYWSETTSPLLMPPTAAADYAVSVIKGWYQTLEQEVSQQCAY